MGIDVADNPFALNAELPMTILSPSSISCFMRCPEQFRHEYMLREKRAPGAWAISGSAFHDARHAILEAQMTLGKPLAVEAVEPYYTVAWDKRMEKEGTVEWRGTTADAQFQIGLAMTKLYHETLGREVIPIQMEYGAKGYVDGVPLPIYGRIDVETHEEIIDTKTGKQLFHQLKPEHKIQGCIYVMLTGKPMRWHSVSGKPAVSTNDELTLAPTPRVLAAAERFARDAYEGIVTLMRTRGVDTEWPLNGTATGTCRYCSFRSRCPLPD